VCRRCYWRSDRCPNGPRPLAGSVERLLGREIERDPVRHGGRSNSLCLLRPEAAASQKGKNDAMGHKQSFDVDLLFEHLAHATLWESRVGLLTQPSAGKYWTRSGIAEW
jgi:hypothetical protein